MRRHNKDAKICLSAMAMNAKNTDVGFKPCYNPSKLANSKESNKFNHPYQMIYESEKGIDACFRSWCQSRADLCMFHKNNNDKEGSDSNSQKK